jgi:hypothetical protein
MMTLKISKWNVQHPTLSSPAESSTTPQQPPSVYFSGFTTDHRGNEATEVPFRSGSEKLHRKVCFNPPTAPRESDVSRLRGDLKNLVSLVTRNRNSIKFIAESGTSAEE